MTQEQLDLLGTVMRANKDSLSFLSAKLVLVEGSSQIDAAKVLGTKPNTVNNGVQRYKKVHEDFEKAYKKT